MPLRRHAHGRHEAGRHRVRAREAEVAQQRQELSHNQVDHGERNARRNRCYESKAFEDVELGIAQGEDALQDVSQRLIRSLQPD